MKANGWNDQLVLAYLVSSYPIIVKIPRILLKKWDLVNWLFLTITCVYGLKAWLSS